VWEAGAACAGCPARQQLTVERPGSSRVFRRVPAGRRPTAPPGRPVAPPGVHWPPRNAPLARL